MTAEGIANTIFKDTSLDPEPLANAIKQYAKEKCKEQRELCTHFIKPNYDPNNTGNWNVVDFDGDLVKKILNAPKPEFD